MIDASSVSVVEKVTTPSTACGVAVNSQTDRVYVTAQQTGAVSVIDANTHTVIASRSLFEPARTTEFLPNDVDVNPRGEGVYVVNKTSGVLVAAAGDLSTP